MMASIGTSPYRPTHRSQCPRQMGPGCCSGCEEQTARINYLSGWFGPKHASRKHAARYVEANDAGRWPIPGEGKHRADVTAGAAA